ncbi:MAG: class I SAM-dependent methyltransferase, partial [Alphaproteobacteria bacterium]|nr:class I SAM-dependent methyltransferase [Alphaproteobacteria bacterium]
GAIMLAQQLADRGAGTVTYLDLSEASLAVAKGRAEARGLGNISFHHGSLLDLPGLGWPPFDYIDCCGVLHHLDAPEAGLAALVSVLAEHGGLGLMLYGELGRTGVYPAQRAIARLAGDLAGDGPATERLNLARRLVDAMPEGNWLKRNDYLSDHLAGDDAGFYDLLLHSRDRAYLVGEIVALAAAAGLRLTGFLPAGAYDPGHYLGDLDLRERAAALPQQERWALAEELSGAMKTHVFYAVRQGNEQGGAARGLAPAMVPVLLKMAPDRLAASLAKAPRLTAELGGVERQFEVPDGAAAMIALIDGRRSLRQIHGRLRAGGAKLNWAEFEGEFSALYNVLHSLNLLLFAGAVLD